MLHSITLGRHVVNLSRFWCNEQLSGVQAVTGWVQPRVCSQELLSQQVNV